jgi:hypothetical protein
MLKNVEIVETIWSDRRFYDWCTSDTDADAEG